MERPKAFGELSQPIFQEQKKGCCAHPLAGPTTCVGGVTKAHTVQKEGGLRAIAEQGKVISLKKGAFAVEKNEGELVPAEDGIGNASTFPGFCNHHDGMFSPAENQTTKITLEVAFLLSYRAAAYELFQKEAALRTNKIHKEEFDRGMPFDVQAQMQQMLHVQGGAIERGLADAKRCKDAYDTSYYASYANFNFAAVTFDSVLPAATCGAIFPEFDLMGNRLQTLTSPQSLDALSINLTTLSGRGVLILGWLGTSNAPMKFALSYLGLPREELANAGVRLALECIENTYCRPSWWNNLPEADRSEAAHSNVNSTGPSMVFQRKPDGICKDGKAFASATVISVTTQGIAVSS